MPISTTENRKVYAGDGTSTAFSFPYLFYADADLTVVLVAADGTEATKVLTTHYTVTGAGESAGGTVTMLTAPAVGETLVILREVDLKQETDFVENDPLPVASIEEALDRAAMADQQLQEQIDRSLRLSAGVTGKNTTVAAPVAGRTLKWNSTGTALVNSDNDPDVVVATAAASATSAAASAASAATDAEAVADALETYSNIYYGPLASDPTVDPSGGAPNAGDEYFNTTSNRKRIYNGTAWYTPDLDATDFAATTGAGLVGSNDGASGSLWTTIAGFITYLASSAGSSIVGFLQAGTGAVSRTVQAKLRDQIHIADFGVSTANTAAQNNAAMQAAFDHIRTNGGHLVGDYGTYLFSAVLDARCTAAGNKAKPRSFDGRGMIFDFSASALTSGKLLRFGADALGNASETTWSEVKNFQVIGPENTDNIIAKSAYRDANLGGGDASATTTLVGVAFDYAIRHKASNIYVSRVHKAFQYYFCWHSRFESLYAHKAIVGHHIDTGCTKCTHILPSMEFVTYSMVLHPSSAGGVVISNQTIIDSHFENVTVGPTLDPTASGQELQAIHFINEYMENVYQDAHRVGVTFTDVPASATVRGADRAGKITSLVVDGAKFTGSGTSTGYGANRKGFYFASTANVASGRLLFPCSKDDISNLPPHVEFASQVRAEDIATQKAHTINPGEGHAHVGSAGNLIWNDGGLISASSRSATGVFNLTLKKALSSADNAAMLAVSRQTGLFASIDDAGTTTTNIRVHIKSDAGALTDGKFTIHVKGELAAL